MPDGLPELAEVAEPIFATVVVVGCRGLGLRILPLSLVAVGLVKPKGETTEADTLQLFSIRFMWGLGYTTVDPGT
jgi:hypothetical protein